MTSKIHRALFTGLTLLLSSALIGCGTKGVSSSVEGPLDVTVVDAASGVPVEGVRVSVVRPNGLEVCSSTTTETGAVHWDRCPVEGVEVRVSDSAARYVSVRAPLARAGSLRVELTFGVMLSLAVVDEEGEPIPARLHLWPRNAVAGEEFPTSRDGTAHIGPVAAGPTKVFVVAEGHTTRVLDLNISSDGADIGEVRLERGGAVLTGRSAPELEIQPTEVYLRFAGAGLATPIGAGGRFEFRGLPAAMTGTIVFRRDGRELFSRDVVVSGPKVDIGTVRPQSS